MCRLLGPGQRCGVEFGLRRNNSGNQVTLGRDEVHRRMEQLHLGGFRDPVKRIRAGQVLALFRDRRQSCHPEQQQEYSGPYRDAFERILPHRLTLLSHADLQIEDLPNRAPAVKQNPRWRPRLCSNFALRTQRGDSRSKARTPISKGPRKWPFHPARGVVGCLCDYVHRHEANYLQVAHVDYLDYDYEED